MAEISLEGLSEADIRNLAALAAGLSQDPKTRRGFQRLVKERNPEFTAPELEVDDAVQRLSGTLEDRFKGVGEQLTSFKTELEKQQQAQQEREARERWNALKQAPIEAGIISADELPAVEELMKSEGFNNTQYMQAAKYFVSQKQVATPTPAMLSPFKLPDKDKLRANPKQAFRENMIQALNESQTRRVTGSFGKVA